MRTVAVFGKNFGDEGKGLAVDYFSAHGGKTLVARHNGGAQSGHTVELKDGKRFVFHELSSGSFKYADTLWTDTFYPDLYKLKEEAENFRLLAGFVPTIFALENTNITLPDDVLINMALEELRGENRHGSCGMGINECDLRTRAGFGLTLGYIRKMDLEELTKELERIRNVYVPQRLKELGFGQVSEIDENFNTLCGKYLELLRDDNVLKNAAKEIFDNLQYVEILTREELKEKLKQFDTLIFESGQGLLLDRKNEEYAPHVTASDTGLDNPCRFLKSLGLSLDEAVYVSRSYVTRHGAGKLNCECDREKIGDIMPDKTNEYNSWQGHIRYAFHEDEDSFVKEVNDNFNSELKNDLNGTVVSLFLTHLNETDNCVAFKNQKVEVSSFIKWKKIADTFDRVYLSNSRFSDDVKCKIYNVRRGI